MMNLIGQEIGNYKLLDLLGRGGSADVYLGEHKHQQSHNAIKVQRKEVVGTIPCGRPFSITMRRETQARNESLILSHVTHPHVIRVYEYGIQDDAQFLVMDWATQGTLLDLFTKSLSMRTVAIYVKQIADALQYLHLMHITHRDVKPTNILIAQDASVLLADFELAVDYRRCQSTAGTSAYAAPEQKQGRFCPASDQYALGVLIYQWLCGELPFHGSPAEMVAQHRNISPPPLREKVPALPSAVERVVLTALAKDPNSRFPNIQMFAKVFEQACQSSAYWTPAMLIPDSLKSST